MTRFLSRNSLISRRGRRRRRNPGPLSFISHRNSRNSQSTHRKLACVGIRRRREWASVCDEGTFRFPEECSLQLNPPRRSSTSGASALLREVCGFCVRLNFHPDGGESVATRHICFICAISWLFLSTDFTDDTVSLAERVLSHAKREYFIMRLPWLSINRWSSGGCISVAHAVYAPSCEIAFRLLSSLSA